MLASSLRRVIRFAPKALIALVFAILGAVVAALVAGIIFLNSKPELSVWHHVDLDEEFTRTSKVATLEEYLALEDRLFAQLRAEVYDEIDDSERTEFNRYNAGSRSDPEIWPRNWNRTFELPNEAATFGVLLLHGYSDSPYSLAELGQLLHADGGEVLGMRMPGHGTAPSGLIHATFDDMAAAVRIGMRHLKGRLGERPLFIVGYSNGGALATNYTLASIEEADLPRPAGVVLFSPEIGIDAIAAYSNWQARIGDLLGLDNLAWNSVLPEYDPYKYNSFAVNAGYQAYEATVDIQSQLDRLKAQGRLSEIPPILAFQSAADATVLAPALVERLFNRLEPGGHELVVFDINQMFAAQGLIKSPIDLDALLKTPATGYGLTVVTNRDAASASAVLRERPAGQTATTVTETGLAWPADVYSLSHIAVPFAPDDPLYGSDDDSENPGLRLGRLALRGENNTLAIPTTAMTRQHWNPFFPILSERVRRFVGRALTQQGG